MITRTIDHLCGLVSVYESRLDVEFKNGYDAPHRATSTHVAAAPLRRCNWTPRTFL
jgi:hypothetical protein